MILPTYITNPDYNLTKDETTTLIRIIQANPLKLHGVRRVDPKLCGNIRSLNQKGLIERRGYQYAGTKYGWLHYFKIKEQIQKQQKTKQTLFLKLVITGSPAFMAINFTSIV